jgi:hypothetical protein
MTYTRYDDTDASRMVRVTRADGSVVRQIDYFGSAAVGASNTTFAEFVEDQWAIGSRFNLHGGFRYDYEQIAGQQTLSPRVDAAFTPFATEHTVVKGGGGILDDKLPLNAADFESQQSRPVTEYDPQGDATAVTVLTNRVAADGQTTPRSKTWNVEVDQRITKPGGHASAGRSSTSPITSTRRTSRTTARVRPPVSLRTASIGRFAQSSRTSS